MGNFLVNTIRKMALKKNAVTGSTHLAPLSSIKSALVFADGCAPTAKQDIEAIRRKMESLKIKPTVFAIDLSDTPVAPDGQQDESFIRKRHISPFGWIKKNKHTPAIPMDTDLFISLMKPDCFAVEYAMRCSRAKTKCGCTRYDEKYYDILVTEPEGKTYPQFEVFETMLSLIEKVK